MRKYRWFGLAVLTWFFIAGVIIVPAQTIPKEDYIKYLPLSYPRIKIQSPASPARPETRPIMSRARVPHLRSIRTTACYSP